MLLGEHNAGSLDRHNQFIGSLNNRGQKATFCLRMADLILVTLLPKALFMYMKSSSAGFDGVSTLKRRCSFAWEVDNINFLVALHFVCYVKFE